MKKQVLTRQELNKSEQVYERLKAYILSPDRIPGERLVSNRKLAEILETSTFPIHQALQRLETDGYIETRRGAGTYIASRHQPITMADTVTLCMDAHGHLWSTLTAMLMEALADHGRIGTLLALETGRRSRDELIQRMAHSQSDTMIVQAGGYFPFHVFDLPGMQHKTVIAVLAWASNRSWPGLHRIIHDRQAGADMVVDYLKERGHHHVLVTGTDTQIEQLETDQPNDISPAHTFRLKWESDKRALTALVSDPRYTTDTAIGGGFDQNDFLALFDSEDAPTAIFGLRDYEAWYAQGLLLRHRPELATTIDIIGYGNTPWSQASHLPFTTIDYNFATIVETAVMIIDKVNAGTEPENIITYVKPKLVTRKP